MKIVIDMNLSPAWVSVFDAHGHSAKHWTQVGSHTASDAEILRWARENKSVVFTNDLDFGAIIAASGAAFPSVIQLRDLDVTPDSGAIVIMRALDDFSDHLERGALVSVDARRSRVHILPIRSTGPESGPTAF